MEEFENNLFRKRTKVELRRGFLYSERLQRLIEKVNPRILSVLKNLFLIVIIFLVINFIEDIKNCCLFVYAIFLIIIGKATEIADTPLSSLTIGKFITVLLLYRGLCRILLSCEKNTPD